MRDYIAYNIAAILHIVTDFFFQLGFIRFTHLNFNMYSLYLGVFTVVQFERDPSFFSPHVSINS